MNDNLYQDIKPLMKKEKIVPRADLKDKTLKRVQDKMIANVTSK